MKSTTELDTICPYCGYFADRTGYPLKEGTIPTKGDISFCIKCGQVSEFGELLHLQVIDILTLPFETQEEIAIIKQHWRTVN